ncbi:MAG: gliding motility protein GldM [Bacteroidales bacterium]|jgi:gliding motility-associated protein GldM|nr:gliding motility protein GldM [Bacteroidales bacterium]
MGHGKETPRQKMIGMMYLMLTAMLALNVSAEVLDAFRLVDEGLKKTTENFVDKNKILYKEFEKKFAENEKKVKPWKDKANIVHQKADELYNIIQDQKIEMIKKNQGKDIEKNDAIEGREIINAKIKGIDKNDVSTRYMIGDNKNGEAYKLKDKIIEFRKLLLDIVGKDNMRIINSINSSLDTSDPSNDEEGGGHGNDSQKSWELKHFSDIPMGAIMPIMSKIQGDVRNVESDVVQYLFDQINAGSFSFNKLEATIIPNSNNIISGNEYSADVFLAAVDTTAPPIVYIGKYDSTLRENGYYEYNMVGNYDSLEIVNGKGKFSNLTTRLGLHEWGGIIKLRGPDGNYIKKVFRRSYNVAKPNLVVSPTKMNVFYVGVDNPVSVSVAGVPDGKISPSITNASIRKQRSGEYIVNPKRPGNSLISVVAEIDGKRKKMGTISFRVKALPDPVAKVAGKGQGNITKNTLAAQTGVVAVMENFQFDLEFSITEFTVSTTDKGGYFVEEKTKGARFSKGQYDLIKNLKRNKRVNIEDIKAIGPDGVIRSLPPIVFKII